LNDKIKRNGPLTEKEITDVFSQTLSAFQYAHEKGIVHRDIKPSNIFILKNGHVKILDFGIAKLFGQGNEMTQTGTQMGTPIYMSPEQVKADKSIDHRSDIYSLGVTMFYAINGKPPYDTDKLSQFDVFSKIVYEPLPELQSQGAFIKLIRKATQKDREQRFQSCKEWVHTAENYFRIELQGQTTISDSLHNEPHAEAKENATFQEEIDHQNTESNENSGLNLSSDRDTNNEYNGNNNAVKNKLKGIKLLKWVNIIQITWFSFFVLACVYLKFFLNL
jgi:serine/threonine protein kinase